MSFLKNYTNGIFYMLAVTVFFLSFTDYVSGEDWEILYKKGRLSFKRNSYEESIKYLKKSLKINPHNIRIYSLIGTAYLKSGDKKMAKKYWEEGLKIEPDNTALSGLIEEMDEDFPERVLNKENPLWIRYALKGEYYFNKFKFDKALYEFKKAIRIKPDDFYLYFSLGSIYTRLVNLEVKLEPFERKIENFEEAVKNWERALEIKQDDDMTKSLLKKIKERIEMFKTIIPDDRSDIPEDYYDEMAFIPAGKFFMGSTGEEGKLGEDVWPDQLPQHEVYVEDFYIDRFEVPNREYKKFVDAAGRKPPDNENHDYDLYIWHNKTYAEGRGDYPVSLVTWYDAEAYCKWKGKRLPTEEEWEKAARGAADKRRWPWGDTFIKSYCNILDTNLKSTMPVWSFKSGISMYGIYNMIGNVSEWTSSWYDAYPGNTYLTEKHLRYHGKRFKVRRGGSFRETLEFAWVTARISVMPDYKHRTIGFRCVSSTSNEQ